MVCRLVCLAAILACLESSAAPLRENLVEIRTGSLAPLADSGASHVVAVDGRLVAFERNGARVLEAKQGAWTRLDWRPEGELLGVGRGKARAFLLLGAERGGRMERIEEFSLDPRPASRRLPPLPFSLGAASVAMLGETVFVAGAGAKGTLQLLSLDLAAAPSAWVEHPGWPGKGGKVTSVTGQTGAVYVTMQGDPGQGERFLRWKAPEGWSERGAVPGRLIAGAAGAAGQAHILYLVRSAAAADAVRFMTFHTITGSWAQLGEWPDSGAHSGAAWNNGIVWMRVEAGGGASFDFADIAPTTLLLGWLDWIVLFAYLAAMVGIGLYFYLKEKRQSTAQFFVGGRSIPFWAAGVSLYATNTSSISFIAIPAKAFETNWTYLTNNLVAVMGLMFVAIWIVPVLRRLDLMSVFHYLEIRFHPVIRTLSSLLCIVVQIGSRMSVILFLPSLAIATITGIPVTWSVLIMGVITILYTALGGMKAVIWTDFAQLIVMMGGIVFAIAFVVWNLDGGWGEFFATAAAEDKMKLLDFRFDLTKATVWGFIFLVVFDVILTFPKDQVLMQRVLSTRNSRDASRSIWTFAAIMIPGGFMFYFVGTALYAFYKSHPGRMNPLLTVDATFPLFIAAELPVGVKGLIIAGIFAAAMSTLSSIMNSVATLASVDFFERMVKNPTQKQSVIFAEAMTVATGIVGIGAALVISRYDVLSLFDVSIELAGLLGGGFAGAYTLGMFTRRANWQGVAIGVTTAITATFIAWSMDLVHPYFYLGISIMLCIAAGYLGSLLFPPPSQSLAGLTIYDKKAG